MKTISILVMLLIQCFTCINGCDCLLGTVDENINDADGVMTIKILYLADTLTDPLGQVIDYNSGYVGNALVIEELKKSKNELSRVITIRPLSSSYSNCTFKLKKGEEYLIFYRKHDYGYEVIECSRSGVLAKSKRNLKKIRKLLAQ